MRFLEHGIGLENCRLGLAALSFKLGFLLLHHRRQGFGLFLATRRTVSITVAELVLESMNLPGPFALPVIVRPSFTEFHSMTHNHFGLILGLEDGKFVLRIGRGLVQSIMFQKLVGITGLLVVTYEFATHWVFAVGMQVRE